MLKLLKKSAYISIGAAVLSANVLKQLGEKVAQDANLSEDEGKKLVEDLMKQSKKSKQELQENIEKTINDSLSNLDIAKGKDVKRLQKRLKKIEAQLADLTEIDLDIDEEV